MTTTRLRRVEELTRDDDCANSGMDDAANLIGELLIAIPSARVLEKLSTIDP